MFVRKRMAYKETELIHFKLDTIVTNLKDKRTNRIAFFLVEENPNA